MYATTPSAERGAAVLPLVALLLFALALIVLAAARAEMTAHRLAAADADGRAAFAAAQAGLEHGLARAGTLLRTPPAFDGEGRAVVDGPGAMLATGAGYRVTIDNHGLIAYDLSLVEVESTGTGAGGAQRRMRQQARLRPWVAAPPQAALVVRGDATFSGGLDIANPASALVRTGGAFSAPGALLAPGDDPPCPPAGICANEAALAAVTPEALFAATFARDVPLLRRLADARPCPGCAPEPLPADAASLWLRPPPGEAYVLGPASLGSPGAPVAVVVDGDLVLAGDVRIDGLLYVTGDWLASHGSIEVRGAVIVAGHVHHTGAARIAFDADALEHLATTGRYARIAGSWSDRPG